MESTESILPSRMDADSYGPNAVIVTGPPCAGKTTLARHIASGLQLPLLAKDTIKESLFASLGWKDRKWSKRLSAASFDLLFVYLESLLRAGCSCIVDGNFQRESHTSALLDLKSRAPFQPIQILCSCEGRALVQRFEQRAANETRHPGHVDHVLVDELRPSLIQGECAPLEIGGSVVNVDTTDLESVDHAGLLPRIRAHLTNRPAGDVSRPAMP